MEFKIGRWTFKTKKAALEAVRKVLQATKLNEPLCGEDYEIIRALIDLHPRAIEKLQGGCRAIVVRVNKLDGMPPQRGFWIERDDGTGIDFSIYVPFQSEEQTKKSNIAWAAREAVRKSVQAYKKNYFAVTQNVSCEITGESLSWDDAVVHHSGDWAFSKILSAWIQSRGSDPMLIDGGITKVMVEDDARDFCDFHDARAILQVVHKRINSSLGAG